MTVKKLINKLKALNMPDALVVTPSSDEVGYDDVADLMIIRVSKNPYPTLGQYNESPRGKTAVLINW